MLIALRFRPLLAVTGYTRLYNGGGEGGLEQKNSKNKNKNNNNKNGVGEPDVGFGQKYLESKKNKCARSIPLSYAQTLR